MDPAKFIVNPLPAPSVISYVFNMRSSTTFNLIHFLVSTDNYALYLLNNVYCIADSIPTRMSVYPAKRYLVSTLLITHGSK